MQWFILYSDISNKVDLTISEYYYDTHMQFQLKIFVDISTYLFCRFVYIHKT